ncbi:uncharacterized protein LOC142769282 isoform X1 [Rhipicephalus microplus]|uniref:uncharacterized protein LOC142769282 isoform X1 n=1 Tax=Rhipicephalus microplus TaxID=6941 RepID=UPI003F6A55D8
MKLTSGRPNTKAEETVSTPHMGGSPRVTVQPVSTLAPTAHPSTTTSPVTTSTERAIRTTTTTTAPTMKSTTMAKTTTTTAVNTTTTTTRAITATTATNTTTTALTHPRPSPTTSPATTSTTTPPSTTTTLAPVKAIFCTVGETATSVDMYPSEYCDYIFYTNVYPRSGQIDVGGHSDRSWTVFQEVAAKRSNIEFGVSFSFQYVAHYGFLTLVTLKKMALSQVALSRSC